MPSVSMTKQKLLDEKCDAWSSGYDRDASYTDTELQAFLNHITDKPRCRLAQQHHSSMPSAR